ncbi:AAA family ATPase [Acinetobacter bereziniae]|uniref:McrB family protein n=1 Tax=Acinetobacter bereziniae TaxID=106648 RepID=UPI001D0D9AB1|nr:AAA family ATPase [Acinetobacter bereziniae]
MNYWMLGADWDGDDQTPNFIEQGIWQNGYTNKFLDTVKKVKVGDKVAIKTVYVQKNNLPFNNFGCDVSCMKVKVIGEVTENVGDGRTLKVKWEPLTQEHLIYLYTYWHTIMRIARPFVKEWIFDKVPQNYTELEEIYKKKSGRVEDKLSDEQILDHFKTVDGYLEIIQNEAHKSLFLEFVRFMHDIPLDWWITHNDIKHQIRFGCNHNFHGQNSTNRILAYLKLSPEGLLLTSNQDDFFSAQDEILLTRELFEELKKGDFIGIEKDRDPYVGYLPKDYVEMNMNENKKTSTFSQTTVLNRILFGAAGTGKTFHSINHALSIIENKPLEVLEEEDRTALKTRFDQYKEQGQIKFVTFHQSFSYEDFVEGIRAESQKDELGKSEITYPIASGVFKSICSLASEGEFDSTTSNYEELINIVVDNLLNKLKNDELVVLQTKTGKKFSLHQGSSDKNIVYRTTSGYSNSISIGSVKKELKLELEERKTHPVYEPKLVEALQEDIKKIMRQQNPLKPPYVLIIDEINRGNISRIFGELITLIEDSKRQGAEEELSVTLPYSKEEFSVPSNVYIIGTMNSSDRSLTGLDIALRRRFTFIEMPPKPELLSEIEVEGVNVGELLKVINQRIEVLLDRDHCIGHANFMSLNKQPTLKHLASIFKQKIIPQLQEYFFDDWAKINMVLNANGMLKPKPIEHSVLFPNVDTESEGLFEDQKIWQIIETAFDSIESFAKINKY